MNAVRVMSGVALDTQEPFVQIRTADEEPSVILTQMTPKEAVQMAVYLINAAGDAANDSIMYRYMLEAGLRAGLTEDRAKATASASITAIRECRATGELKIPGVSNG